jgi:dihydrofolate reductase
MSMSLDGYVAGPNQDVDHPLGVGGTRLHEWAFPLRAFREMHGQEGGEVNESTPIIAEQFHNVGASILGRNMFGGQPGPWSTARPWTGWWGLNPPYHHPVFVLTHHARPPLEMQGGTTFHFVTGGLRAALEEAKRAAAGKDVSLGGGAQTAREALGAGWVDQLVVSLVPVLLGAGERLFDGLGDTLHGLTLNRTIPAPGVIHLEFVRR